MTTKEKIANQSMILTDGGLETTLIFQNGIDLPHFAAFDLINKPQYKKVLSSYYKKYMNLAVKNNTGFIMESPTWRANPDWGYKLGYSEKELVMVNKQAIADMQALSLEYSPQIETILISGCIGPRGDGYTVKDAMTAAEAATYHNDQIIAFKEAGADLTSAFTMNYINEGLGISLAAKKNRMLVVISFTVETNGNLPSGESLKSAIESIDKQTKNYPLYYMINCAHPSHFIHELEKKGAWKERIMGIRANASCKSHTELDESTEIDSGDIINLANWHKILKQQLPNLKVYGGCCGTDHSHIEAISDKVGQLHHYLWKAI